MEFRNVNNGSFFFCFRDCKHQLMMTMSEESCILLKRKLKTAIMKETQRKLKERLKKINGIYSTTVFIYLCTTQFYFWVTIFWVMALKRREETTRFSCSHW